MVKLEFLVICENVLNDGGRVSLINIYDTVNATTLPSVVPKFCLAFAFFPDKTDKDNAKVKFKVDIIKPSESLLFSVEGDASTDKGSITSQPKVIGALDLSGGLNLDEKGKYTAILYLGSKKIAETHFDVKEVKTA